MWLVSVRIRLGATLDIVKSPVNVPPASGNLFVIAALEDVLRGEVVEETIAEPA